MNDQPVEEMKKVQTKERSNLKKPIFIALLLMLLLVVAWHLFFPLLGIAIAISAAVWGIIVGTIVFLSVGTLLFFVFTGLGILIVSIAAFVWVALAIILFPFLFPIFIPLLIILLFVAYVRRRKNRS